MPGPAEVRCITRPHQYPVAASGGDSRRRRADGSEEWRSNSGRVLAEGWRRGRTEGRRKRFGNHGRSLGRIVAAVVAGIGVVYFYYNGVAQYSLYFTVECTYCTLTLQCTILYIQYTKVLCRYVPIYVISRTVI